MELPIGFLTQLEGELSRTLKFSACTSICGGIDESDWRGLEAGGFW